MTGCKEVYRSKVHTERPAYADYDAPAKFQAIQSIVARRLRELVEKEGLDDGR